MMSGASRKWDILAGFMLLGLFIEGMLDRFHGGTLVQKKDGSWKVSYSDQWAYASDWLTAIYCIVLSTGYFWYIRHKLGKAKNIQARYGNYVIIISRLADSD